MANSALGSLFGLVDTAQTGSALGRFRAQTNQDLESIRKEFQAAGKDVTAWTNGFQKQMSVAGEALVSFREGATVSFERFAQGVGASVALSTVYSKSIEEAMARSLKATAASIVAESVVQALRSLGLGFYLLALRDFGGAASAFKSAAIWGSIGGVAAGLSGALPAGGERGVQAPRSDAASRSTPAAAASPATSAPGPGFTGGQLNVLVMGEPQAAQWLTQVINRGVERYDLRLVASHTRRPPYAGR